MEGEKILQLARKHLSLYPLTVSGKIHYDVFRKQVSRSFLFLFKMSEVRWKNHTWENGVNLARQMQAIFQVRTEPQSPRHAQLLENYDGRSRKLARVIDVRQSSLVPSRKVT